MLASLPENLFAFAVNASLASFVILEPWLCSGQLPALGATLQS